jgi:hypothetical protein
MVFVIEPTSLYIVCSFSRFLILNVKTWFKTASKAMGSLCFIATFVTYLQWK